MKNSNWIWYPGDFEIYHGMLQNFSREERGFHWPAFWRIDDCHKNVKFFCQYELTKSTNFTVYSHSSGYVTVNDKKHRFMEKIECGPGICKIVIYAGQITGVPSVYVEGDIISTIAGQDEKDTFRWLVSDFSGKPVKPGYSLLYNRKEQNPSIWEYSYCEIQPSSVKEINGGLLYELTTEMVAGICVHSIGQSKNRLVCYGESVTEALDTENCYYSQMVKKQDENLPARAFRYLFIPDTRQNEIYLEIQKEYVDIPKRAAFKCNEEEINQIWDVAVRTFSLCSGVFFIDGIKRDRWIWSGDAYQSYFINQYLMFDEEINKRTIWALRGNDPIGGQINTILDYSMYWIISIENHYHMTGDTDFIHMIYPKMQTMMEFLQKQTDDKGFIIGREGDWIFIDWADLDKEGPVCAEQILWAECFKTMYILETEVLGRKSSYEGRYEELVGLVKKYYWDQEKEAYIDGFISGKRHISRQTNAFAVLFGIADQEQTEKILKNVMENTQIDPITTPYFQFYELEVLCRLGKRKEVLERIKQYWGGMLRLGATTFWEEFDAGKQKNEHYNMYGDPYGKSLCHAWAGSPIYLIGRYFMGIAPVAPGYKTYVIEPDLSLFHEFSCTFPVGPEKENVCMKWDGVKLRIKTTKEGGILKYRGKELVLNKGEEYCF